MNEEYRGVGAGFVDVDGKNKRWYLQHRFSFLVVWVCFRMFCFFSEVSEAPLRQSNAAEHTRGAIVVKKYINQHISRRD